jgi:hypothetical protein
MANVKPIVGDTNSDCTILAFARRAADLFMDFSQISCGEQGAGTRPSDDEMMFENQTLDQHKDESRFKVGAGPTESSSIADRRPRRLGTYRYPI